MWTLARGQGFEIGAEARRRAGARARRAVLIETAVARENKEIVCGMNLALMGGLVDGLRIRGVAARLDPKPGFCCVAIGARKGAAKERG